MMIGEGGNDGILWVCNPARTGAILLWATLASLTTLKGPSRRSRPRPSSLPSARRWPCSWPCCGAGCIAYGRRAASLALGIYGLFGYHALYFAALKLAPPAEAHLISSLWALLTVLFSGLLPGAGLRLRHVLAAFLGHGGSRDPGLGQARSRAGRRRQRLGFALALGCALVWSSYSVASRLLAAVPSESIAVVLPGDRRAGLRLQPRLREVGHAGRSHRPGWRCWASASARWAPPSCCGTSA